MTVYLNDEPQEIPGKGSLLELLEQLGLTAQRMAVTINDNFIPRTQWGETALSEGDKIIVIKAVFGG